MPTVFHEAASRGHVKHGWLESHHTFSFASYFNSERMHFGVLRVLNDDTILPSMGFDTHPHDNMEIITVPLTGALKHKDTMGNEFIIQKGEVQVMSAGTGIAHSEFNASDKENVSLLQIWILPNAKGHEPRYDQKRFTEEGRKNQFQLIVSPDARNGSLKINQNAFFSLLNANKELQITYTPHDPDNHAYFFLISGELKMNETLLKSRDGVGLTNLNQIDLHAVTQSELLIIEVPELTR